MADYTLGNKPPPLALDTGAGAWCSAPQTATLLAYKRALQLALDTRAIDLSIGPDAVAHMRHVMRNFVGNTGSDLQLDMPDLLRKSSQLREKFDLELALAKAFSETLGPGRHEITSTKAAGGYFRQAEDRNLYFAIGGYSFWGQAVVLVEPQGDRALRYTLDFEFHFFDRYNWDSGKSVSIAGVRVGDSFMQQFHQQCYAREYDLRGLARRRLVWESEPYKTGPPAARQRNPFDVLFSP